MLTKVIRNSVFNFLFRTFFCSLVYPARLRKDKLTKICIIIDSRIGKRGKSTKLCSSLGTFGKRRDLDVVY